VCLCFVWWIWEGLSALPHLPCPYTHSWLRQWDSGNLAFPRDLAIFSYYFLILIISSYNVLLNHLWPRNVGAPQNPTSRRGTTGLPLARLTSARTFNAKTTYDRRLKCVNMATSIQRRRFNVVSICKSNIFSTHMVDVEVRRWFNIDATCIGLRVPIGQVSVPLPRYGSVVWSCSILKGPISMKQARNIRRA